MGLIAWFKAIKEEQLEIERQQKILLHNIRFELKEIKSFMELSVTKQKREAKQRTSKK